MPKDNRTYQGRPLPRPQDELVDQGLGFDLGTLFSRRRMLGLLGLGAGAATGVPMTMELTVLDLANGKPFQGTAVYVWQCDAQGRYSMYSAGAENANYLRGVQLADAEGRVRFHSVFPGCYPGRWSHVHFEVYPDGGSITEVAKVIATSQLALPKEVSEAVYAQPGYESSGPNFQRVSLARDSVFRDDPGATQLATVTGDVRTGYMARLTIGVDTRTAPR